MDADGNVSPHSTGLGLFQRYVQEFPGIANGADG